MREQAYTTTHPDLEELAAFIDCTLPAEDRARVMAHLAECEDCYTVFSETVHLQQQESEPSSSRGRGVLPFPLAKKPKPYPPKGGGIIGWLAAAVLLPVAAFSLYQAATSRHWLGDLRPASGRDIYLALKDAVAHRASDARSGAESLAKTGSNLATISSGMSAVELVRPLQHKIEVAQLWQPETFRGPGGEEIGISPRQTFQLGVTLVHLQAAIQAENVEQTLDSLARVNSLLQAEDFIDEEKKYYEKAIGDLYQSAAQSLEVLRQLRESSPLYEARLDEIFESPYLPFGKWSEAGRLSAIARSRVFFENRYHRKFPDWLLEEIERQEREALDPKIVDNLREIEDLWKSGSDGKPAEELQTAFAEILEFYAGGSEPDRHAPASSSSAR